MGALDDLKAAGFSDQEVQAFGTEKRATLGAAGFSPAEIDEYLGKQVQPEPNHPQAARSLLSNLQRFGHVPATTPGDEEGIQTDTVIPSAPEPGALNMPGSVLNGAVPKQNTQLILSRGAPVSAEYQQLIQAAYDAANQETRGRMVNAPGVLGQVSSAISANQAQGYVAGQSTPAFYGAGSTVEDRTSRYISQGLTPEWARAKALQDIREGLDTGMLDSVSAATERAPTLGQAAIGAVGGQKAARVWGDWESGLVGATGNALSYIGRESGSDAVTALGNSMVGYGERGAPENPSLADKTVQSFASIASFYVPGAGVMKGAEALSVVAPTVARLGGASVMTGLGAAMAADSTYRDMTSQGYSAEEAQARADKVFWANAALMGVASKASVFSEFKSAATKVAADSAAFAAMNAGSAAIGNAAAGRSLEAGTGEAALLGAIGGVGIGVIHHAIGPSPDPLRVELNRRKDGYAPTAEDMANVAASVAGGNPRAAAAAEASLRATYENTGIGPFTVADQAAHDPSIAADLVNPAVSIPKAFEQYLPGREAPVVEPGNGAPLLDLENPGGSQLPTVTRHEMEMHVAQRIVDLTVAQAEGRMTPALEAERDFLLSAEHDPNKLAQAYGVTVSERAEAPQASGAEGSPPPRGAGAPAVAAAPLDEALARPEVPRETGGISDPNVQAELRFMAANEAGWAETGGRGIEGGGRTVWVPKSDWYEAGMGRPEQIQAAIEKAIAGKKLGAQQQRLVDHLVGVASERIAGEKAFGQGEYTATTADLRSAGLDATPQNVFDSQAVARAMEIDPEAVNRAGEAYEQHDSDQIFMADIRRIIGENSQAAGGGAEGAGPAPGIGPFRYPSEPAVDATAPGSITQRVADRLSVAGRVAPEDAQAQGLLMQKFFETMASRTGRSAEELFNRYVKEITFPEEAPEKAGYTQGESPVVARLKEMYGGEQGYANFTTAAKTFFARVRDETGGSGEGKGYSPADVPSTVRLKRASDAFVKEFQDAGIGGLAGHNSDASIGKFKGYRTIGRVVEAPLTGEKSYSLYLFTDEQIRSAKAQAESLGLTANDILRDEGPSLTMRMKDSGELMIYGPDPQSPLFQRYVEQGKAHEATGAGGEVQRMSNGEPWTALTGGTPAQLSKLLAELHARIRMTTGREHLGAWWERATGATGHMEGGETSGRLAAAYFQPAYHGSPYKFDKFTLDHIGSGEGAQAYGWGLYFAGDKSVGEYYRQALTTRSDSAWRVKLADGRIVGPSDFPSGSMENFALGRLLDAYRPLVGRRTDALAIAAKRVIAEASRTYGANNPSWIRQEKAIADFIKDNITDKSSVSAGQLYKVDIPHDDEFLSWGKPLSEQSEKVKAAIINAERNSMGWKGAPQEQFDIFMQRTSAEQYYRDQAEALGGDKAASEYLHSLGVAGIRYLDAASRGRGAGSHNYVVFDENAIKILETYYQENRGSYNPMTGQIALLKSADASTFLHEAGHMFLEVTNDLASAADAPHGLKADMQAILNWMGVKDADAWRAMSIEEKRPFHEQFARGFESYLREGKAPTSALAGIFERFKQWLMKVYESADELGVTLSPEVRGVFDRMLATDEERSGGLPYGEMEFHAGPNPIAALKNFGESYTPFVGIDQERPAKAAHVSGNVEYKPSPMMDSLRKLFAPASRGPVARQQAGIMRANFGEMARRQELALEDLKSTAAKFDKFSTEQQISFIDAMERGKEVAGPGMAEAARDLRSLLDSRRDEVRALGKGQLENFDANYFPHIWKQQDEAMALFRRRPLEGSRAFLKARTIPYTTDGLRWRAYDADGDFIKSFDTEAEAKAAMPEGGRVGQPLTPLTSNPVELALLKAREMDRYIYGQRIFQEMKQAGLARFVGFGKFAPEGWTKIDDRIARVMSPAEEGGMILRGEYYAPDEAATLINNHLTPGLQGNSFFDAWRRIGNMLNGAQLGLSFFHVGFTTTDAMTSKVTLGVKQISRGDILEGAGTVAQGMNPAQPFMNLYKGDRLLRAYLGKLDDPSLSPIVAAIQDAGGRIKMDDFYRNASVNAFKQAIRRGDIWGTTKEFLPTVLDRIGAPIFEWLVPRQKLGVYFDLARDWLAKNPDADLATRREAMGKMWDSVDNRLGQLVYDNLFWNRALKDGLMATVRSVGWNLGTFRELGGGILDIKDIPRSKELSDRTAYVIALPMVAAVYGSLLYYAYNGTGPSTLKDCFYPKTGALRPDGSEDRVSLPTYMKDVFAYGEDVKNWWEYGADPTQTLKNKMHPLLSSVSQMLANQDFFGAAIRNPAAPAVQQVADEAQFIFRQVEPFSFRNYLQQSQAKGEEPSVLGYFSTPSMFGVTPAPAYITKSPEQEESSQVSRLHDSLLRKFTADLKNGAKSDEVVREMINAGMNKQDIKRAFRGSLPTPLPHRLKHFGTEEAQP